MFLTRGYDNPSPEEMQERMGVYVEWMQKMMADGRYKGGQPLDQSGRPFGAQQRRSADRWHVYGSQRNHWWLCCGSC